VVDGNIWNQVGSILADSIADTFRQKCIGPADGQDVALIGNFFAALMDIFEVSIATLNYDNVVYRSVPDFATGFDEEGNFVQRNLFNRKRWPCILHLHGSVHFDIDSFNIDNPRGIFWQPDLGKVARSNAHGSGGYYFINEGWVIPRTTLIAGHGKAFRLTGQPFRSYYSELDRLVGEADALLCLGYGFGDDHVNAVLAGWRDERKRPIVIVDWAADCTMTASEASGGDASATVKRAIGVFDTKPWKIRSLHGVVPNTVAEVKAQKSFDRSTDPARPLAIWYNGMLEACHNAARIIDYLK